ncbi:MAG: patatin-like phospholipase family protein [Methylobacter tundripaludum]|nr:patatin-like phospholipase family protein [Methylobacter tundripaludum]
MNYQFRQITLTIHLAIITAFLNISGCAHQVTHKELHGQQLSLDSPGYYSQASLQKKFQKEWLDNNPPTLGLSLAGGGTKAADFSLGVIQGLDKQRIMPSIDVISTVSGGSYAGLWRESRYWLDHEDAVNQVIYKDCLPSRYAAKMEDKSKLVLLEVCPPFNSTNFESGNNDSYRYQNYLRGYQDIFSSGADIFGTKAFNYQSSSKHSRITNDIGQLVTESLGAAILNIIPNIIFDWEIPISPSRSAYDHGIARTFGATPPSCKEPNGCGDERDLSVDSKEDSFRAEGDISPVSSLSFKDLQHLREQYKMPLWIINTTAGEDRSPWDFTPQAAPEMTVFEFTPYGYGSGTYGYHEGG